MKRRKSSSVRISSTVACIGCFVLEATQCRPWSHVISRVGKSNKGYRPLPRVASRDGPVALRPLRFDGTAEPDQCEFSPVALKCSPLRGAASRIPSRRQVFSGT